MDVGARTVIGDHRVEGGHLVPAVDRGADRFEIIWRERDHRADVSREILE